MGSEMCIRDSPWNKGAESYQYLDRTLYRLIYFDHSYLGLDPNAGALWSLSIHGSFIIERIAIRGTFATFVHT